MQVLPIDVTALVAVILGTSIVLIPIIGLTARFALKPTAEAFARFFDHQGLGDTVRVLERRIDFQEHQIDALEGKLRQLTEGSEFDRKLLESRQKPTASGEPSSTPPTELG